MENKYWWRLVAGLLLVSLAAVASEGEELEASGGPEALLRSERAAKEKEPCRYTRGSWSACDVKTNIRSRKLTLKKGDPTLCQPFKMIQKKCKKSCRYEKHEWSECNAATGEMYRIDKLKPNSDPTCDSTRRVAKKCNNKNKLSKSAKDKGRRNRQ